MGFFGDLKNLGLTPQQFAAVRQLPIMPAGRLVGSTGGAGTTLSVQDPIVPVHEFRVGVIVATGPAGEEDDLTGELYWVHFQAAETGGAVNSTETDPTTEALSLYDADNEYPDDFVAAVSNLAEWAAPADDGTPGGTHLLPTDGTRPVLCHRWHDDNGLERWVMDVATATVVALVAPTTNTSNGGEYNGEVISSSPANAFPAGTACIIQNADEYLAASAPFSHWLDNASGTLGAWPALFNGFDIDGVPVFVISSGRALAPSYTPALGDYLATTEEWNRDQSLTGVGYRGGAIVVKMRSETSGKFRFFSIAADGRITHVTAES